MTEPAGSKPRDAVEITCDHKGCHAFEILGAHGGSVEKIQRLLYRRGWGLSAAYAGGHDLCPAHAHEAVA